MVSHSPATIHCDPGAMVSKELLYSSPGTREWMYWTVAPAGVVTRNILECPELGPW